MLWRGANLASLASPLTRSMQQEVYQSLAQSEWDIR